MANDDVEPNMADGIETRIVLNKDIETFLHKIMNAFNCTRSLKMKIRIALIKNENESIPYDVLTDAHEFYSNFRPQKKKTGEFIDLHTLVKSSKVFNETVPEPVRSPELVQRLSRLKAQQEQREYDGMVKNVKHKRETLGQEFGQVYRTTGQQSMSIINFLVSIAAAFAFGFVSSQYAFSDDLGLRLVFSIVVATVVAIAELYFMAKISVKLNRENIMQPWEYSSLSTKISNMLGILQKVCTVHIEPPPAKADQSMDVNTVLKRRCEDTQDEGLNKKPRL